MRPVLAAASAAGALASGIVLLLAGRAGEEAPRPADVFVQAPLPRQIDLARAAEASGGRRVLVLRGKRGNPRTAVVCEAARSADGWTLHPAAPDPSDPLHETLSRLGALAARNWNDRTGFPDGTLAALALLDVRIVVGAEAESVGVPDRLAKDGGLVPGAGGVFLRVVRAEPVVRVTGDVPDTTDPEALAAALRPAPASLLDPEDALWGGAVTVDAPAPGRYAFAWPRSAAKVTIDGRPAAPVADCPLLVLDLPAGKSRVDVRWRTADARGWTVIASAAVLVASLTALLVALRPAPAAAEADEAPAA